MKAGMVSLILVAQGLAWAAHLDKKSEHGWERRKWGQGWLQIPGELL